MKQHSTMRTLALTALALASAGLAANEHAAGKAVFERVCAACHLPTGDGMPGVFPPVKKSDYFRKATPAHLVGVMSNGLSGEITVNGQRYNSAMPPQSLSADDTAAVLNYVSVVLNAGKPIATAEQVKKLLAK